MAISRKTAAEYASELELAILSRNSQLDTRVGPIADIYIQPTANVLELQNERIRKVQQLLSLIHDGSFTDEELDEFVFNEGIVRLDGSRANAVLIFSRSTMPTANITIAANFPVSTLADEETGSSITFITSDDATLDASNASAYFNPATQRYELQVAAEAVVGSSAGNVGPNRIVRALRPLNGFDTVFNRDPSTGGRDRETSSQLIERYFISLLGTSPAVVSGLEKIVRNQFRDVEDINIVFGNNPLNVRSATDGGAVDAYIIGVAPSTTIETVIFPGAEQIIKLSKQPVDYIVSAGSYIQGIDFELVKDTSGLADSNRAKDGIKWLSSGAAPTVGTPVVITYVYNTLLTQLQNQLSTDDNNVPGRDLLFKEATRVDIALAANVKIRSGFNVATVVNVLSSALYTFINGLTLDEDVEESDLQAVVRAYSGVDNFIITNLSKVGTTGSADIQIGANEYARITSADIILTVV